MMKLSEENGLTLVELLMSIAVFGLMAVAASSLLSSTLDAHGVDDRRYRLYQEGLMIMERVTRQARQTSYLMIPNCHTPVRTILACSSNTNDDDDSYFGDPLFPRFDEDAGSDVDDDLNDGVAGFDDDGDGQTDEGDFTDDDEDGSNDEETLDGVDNDGDGCVDEDLGSDSNGDAESGISGVDDDGDGATDNGLSNNDDDEDGKNNEDPVNAVVYWIAEGTTFREDHVDTGEQAVLSDHATAFQATREAPDRVLVELTLTGEDGETVTFSEYVHLENTYQRVGKRVK